MMHRISFTFLILFASIAQAAKITDRVEGDYFGSGGVKIHYTDQGSGDPVILIHGFAVNPDLNFRRPGIIDLLAKEFRIITIDMRGHGLSGKPYDAESYGAEMAEDVVRLLDHLAIEKAQIVGYSLGGFVTLKLATLHPNRLISIAPCGSGWEPPENSAFQKSLDEFAAALESGKGVKPLAGGLTGDRKAPSESHTAWVMFVTKALNDQKALAAMVRGIPGIGITREELQDIPMPVLSIAGDQDPLKTSVDQMEGLVQKHTVVIVEGADHLQTLQRPEFQDSLIAFLRKHASTELP